MPLRAYHEASLEKPQVHLDRIEFKVEDSEKFFILTDSKQQYEIRVRYIPDFESEYDPERFECFLFENAYLTAENDIFEITESTINKRFGWIFPITALDSNEHTFAEHKSFKHYRHIAYQKLLNYDHTIKIRDDKEEYKISEVFEGLTICILSRDEISKLEEFNLSDYALSFLKYDYLIYKDSFAGKKSFIKDKDIEDLRRGNHKLKIRKSAYNIVKNQYTNSLFIDHVYQTENILTKYILLYQILEHFIQEYGDSQLDKIIKEYQDGAITKNTFRERFGEIQSDRKLVKIPIENANINKDIKQAFQQKCEFLFNDINLTVSKSFADAVYDLRNLITHSYRHVVGKTPELNDLVYFFQAIIFDLLIHFDEKVEEGISEEVPSTKLKANRHSDQDLITESKTIRNLLIRLWNNLLHYLIIKEKNT